MTNIAIPLGQTEKIIDLLYQNIQHTRSTELQSTAECHICQESFLSGDYPERPVTILCDHIFGEGCILKWLSPLSRDGVKNSCPLCRKPILQLRAQETPTTLTMYSYILLATCQCLLFLMFLMCVLSFVIIGFCTANLVIMPLVPRWSQIDCFNIDLLIVAVLIHGASFILLYLNDANWIWGMLRLYKVLDLE